MATPPNTLLEPLSTYPVFEANQLLSSRDLNAVTKYLDQQTRLTRVLLTGVGIVCGLVPRLKKLKDSKERAIELSGGCGVTTEGFLVALEACTLTHYQPIQIPSGAFVGKAASWDDGINGFELFEQTTEHSTPLTEESLRGNKVVALLIECTDEKNESCLDDCDEKGTQREFRVRKLLLEQYQAIKIAEENFDLSAGKGRRRYPGWSLKELLTGHYELTDLYLERFGHEVVKADQAFTRTEVKVDLTSITSYEIFVDRYLAVIKTGFNRVSDALEHAHRAFSPLFSSELPDKTLPVNLLSDRFNFDKFDKLEKANLAELTKKPPLEIQYLYDHLADLILAYEEFRDAAFDLMDVCCADKGWFPRHLFLGEPLTDKSDLPLPPSTVRTPYLQPPVYNGNRARVDAVWLLFERLRALIESFKVPVPTVAGAVRITPSRWGTAPLSERAIPYYYEPGLHHVWNADRHRKARDHQVYSYHRISASKDTYQRINALNNPPYVDPLLYDFEGQDFYRIEGHVGLEKDVVLRQIQDLRARYNLAFDVVALKLDTKENEKEFEPDCTLELLQALYTKMRSDLVCALTAREDESQATEKRETGLGRLVEALVEELSEVDYSGFPCTSQQQEVPASKEVQAKSDEKALYVKCLLKAFCKLFKLYQARKMMLLGQTLFHKFADKHPGMEHKAGVPRGGTFVLVYYEEEMPAKEREYMSNQFKKVGAPENCEPEQLAKSIAKLRRQTIVADFCLPYLCCGKCSPTERAREQTSPPMLFDFDVVWPMEYGESLLGVGALVRGPEQESPINQVQSRVALAEVQPTIAEDGKKDGYPSRVAALEKEAHAQSGDETAGPDLDESVSGGRLTDLMARRLAGNRERLRVLAGENEGLDRNKPFELINGMLDVGRPRSTVELVEEFGHFVASLTHGYRLLPTNERKEAYRILAKIAAETVLDRVAVEPPDAGTREKVAEYLKKLREIDMDLAALRDDWLGSEVARALDEARRDLVRALFN